MPTRIVEGKLPYTGGDAITVDENKVISLNLRDENNLIIYDAQDDEIYVDLQLPDGIKPTDAFPVGVTTGRVLVADGWDKAGTIISAKTTSGDVIKLLYADDGTLWIDNGTGTFKQIYFKSDIDAIVTTLTTYIDGELAKKQNGVTSATAPTDPAEGDLWYDTTSNTLKVYDGTNWNAVGTGGGGSDIEYVTQAEYNALLPGAESDGKHYFIYSTSGGGGGWQPGANTIAYFPFSSDALDATGNNTLTNSGTQDGLGWKFTSGSNITTPSGTIWYVNYWIKVNNYPSTVSALCLANNKGMGYYPYHPDFNKKIFVWYSSNFDASTVSFYPNTGEWHNISYGYDGEKTIYSIDGVSGTLYNGDGYNSGNTFIVSQGADIVISKLILETVARTSQEVADYFNQTKANYGIS